MTVYQNNFIFLTVERLEDSLLQTRSLSILRKGGSKGNRL